MARVVVQRARGLVHPLAGGTVDLGAAVQRIRGRSNGHPGQACHLADGYTHRSSAALHAQWGQTSTPFETFQASPPISPETALPTSRWPTSLRWQQSASSVLPASRRTASASTNRQSVRSATCCAALLNAIRSL